MVMELGSKRISPESREQRPAPLRFGCAFPPQRTGQPGLLDHRLGLFRPPPLSSKMGDRLEYRQISRSWHGSQGGCPHRLSAPVTPLARQISAMVAGTMLFPSSRVVSMQTPPPTSVTMLMAGLRGSPPTASKPLTPRQTPRSLSLPSSGNTCIPMTRSLGLFMAVSMSSTSSMPPSPPLKFYGSSKPTLLLPRKSCCRPRRLRAPETPFFHYF